MNILTNVVELENTSGTVDSAELADRLDEMHDFLTADQSVLSADFVANGGTELRIMLKVAANDDESRDEVEARVENLYNAAFEIAHIDVSESADHASSAARVREFALA